MNVPKCDICGEEMRTTDERFVYVCPTCGTRKKLSVEEMVNLMKDNANNEPQVKTQSVKNVDDTVINEDASMGSMSSGREVERLKRSIDIALNTSDWAKASTYVDKALELTPYDGELYVMKLLAKYRLTNIDDIAEHDLLNDPTFNNAVNYAEGELASRIERVRVNMEMNIIDADEREKQRKQDEIIQQKRDQEIKVLMEEQAGIEEKLNYVKQKKNDQLKDIARKRDQAACTMSAIKSYFKGTIIGLIMIVAGVVLFCLFNAQFFPFWDDISLLGGLGLIIGGGIVYFNGKDELCGTKMEIILDILKIVLTVGIAGIIMYINIIRDYKKAKNQNKISEKEYLYLAHYGEANNTYEVMDTEDCRNCLAFFEQEVELTNKLNEIVAKINAME